MDKNTLSNYGWIVVLILVLSVLLALATPFGGYVRDAVWSTTQGLFDVQDGALSSTLDDMGIAPSVEDLQRKHQFEYYSTFSRAIADVNANTIGVNADCDKADATAGIYTDNGKTYIVLLKDATETNSLTLNENMTINLGGHKLLLELNNVMVAINLKAKNINIDGRLSGSKFETAGSDVIFNVYNGSELSINGGQYKMVRDGCTYHRILFFLNGSLTATNASFSVIDTNKSSSYNAYVVRSNTTGVANLTKCKLLLETEGFGSAFYSGGPANLIDCNIFASSSADTIYGFYNFNTSTLKNCNITAHSNYTPDLSCSSSGIMQSASATMIIDNCYAFGTHSGVQISGGSISVNGGTYESYGHGGIYFSSENTVSYIQNATLRQCEMPDGYIDSGATSNLTGFYIGGGTGCDNITVYMNNCNIYGSRQPFVLRGSDGEKNNTLYISNSTINKDYTTGIRIDNDTHKLYIGKSCNFTANNTTRPSVVTQTEETYIK